MNLYLLGLLIAYAIYIAGVHAPPLTFLLSIVWALLGIYDARSLFTKPEVYMHRLTRHDWETNTDVLIAYVWGDIQDFGPVLSGYSLERMSEQEVEMFERGLM